MKTGRSSSAKILNHDSGMGAPDTDTVRKRALELARIDGRNTFTEQDWQMAKHELHGGHAPEGEGEDPFSESASGRDMVVADAGHHVENMPLEDADNIVEELIVEGMDEAVHERMLEASKLDIREEE